MASFVGLHHRVYLGHLDLSGHTNSVTFGPLARAMQDATTFNDGGYQAQKPGLVSGAATVSGFADWADGAISEEISVDQLGSQYAFTVVPNPTGTVAAGDACWLSRGVIGSQELPMTNGEMAGSSIELAYDAAVAQGFVAHPAAARTVTGTGTGVAVTGPTASQSMYASLHVLAYSGLTSVVFKVQTDDGSGFASASDRITFDTVTATGSQFASVAGDFSTETHARVTWTVTGTGSVSFFAAVGVV